jgi:4-amino-4-deoxy-L-arabinose transferase-like glycosyltransferase
VPLWTDWLAVAALCGFLFFYGLGAGELWRTESLRAIIAAEFLRSGNWVVPTLYGEPLYTKPPGMYAAIALVSWPFGGVTETTARLPSALAATATVFLLYWYFTRQVGRLGGLVVAIVTPTSLMWLDKASTAEIDMLQVFWVTAAILFFLRALEAEDDPSTCPWPWWLASLLCVAGGVLTKWTAPAFFYATVLPLLWRRGQLRLLWGRHHLVSAGLAALVCLAWVAAAVRQTGWEPFYDTVSREALQRLSPSYHQLALPYMAASHRTRLPPWGEMVVHPFVVLGANLPAGLMALVTLWPGFARRWDKRGRRLLQALHCWTWPNLVFWSLVSEHSPRHSFPLLPGMAGLAALVWLAWLTGRLRWPLPLPRPATVLLATLVVWLGAKVVFVHAVTPHRNRGREPQAKGAELAARVPDGATLYLFRLKDEGIMFYYGRPVRRLQDPAELPSSAEPVYCILDEPEWRQWDNERKADVLLRTTDEQGAPIVLVRVGGPEQTNP